MKIFHLVLHLAGREFKLRYRRSVLGWVWAIVLPLLRLMVLAYVFTEIVPIEVPNYVSFLYVGLYSWIWFSSALSSATTSVLDRSDLMLQPGIPSQAIPVTAALGDTMDYLISLPILLAWLVYEVGLTVTAFALLPLMVIQLTMVIGLGLMVAPMHVHIRDVALFVEVTLLLGFYITPIFYSSESIPPGLRWVNNINPVARVIAIERRVLIDGEWPDAGNLGIVVGLAVAFVIVGSLVFRRLRPTLADQL